MKVINDISIYCLSLLGEQVPKKMMNYRLINFCHIVEYNGIYLLYNNLTKELLELSKVEAEIIKSKNITFNQVTEFLIKHWFLVPIDNDDLRLQNQVYEMAKLLFKKDYFDYFFVFTTTDCNARCFYCFEKGIKKVSMSNQLADDTAEFIIKKSKGNHVRINWFGGEPLFNIAAIDRISNHLKNNNISFSSSMTTNGYLFDSDNIERAKNEWNLKSVIITLDGTEEVYNRTKNYIYSDNQSAYQRVLHNIKLLLTNKIYVTVRINLAEHNESDIYDLSDELAKHFSKFENFRVSVKLLYDIADGENKRSDTTHKALMMKLDKLENYLESKGILKIPKLSNKVSISYCHADTDSSVVITPSGALSKCEHFIYDELIGDIYTENIDTTLCDSWKKPIKQLDLCYSCLLYPTCHIISKCPIIKNRICDKYIQANRIKMLERSIIKTYLKDTKRGCLTFS